MRAHSDDFDDGLRARPPGARHSDETGTRVQRALAAGRPEALGADGLLRLQRTAGNSGVGSLLGEQEEPSPVREVIGSGRGQPLDPGIREEMGARFGADFGDVRVHTDDRASESARSVNAHAYTVGSNVVFQRDAYAPDTDTGRRTLAHELAHVLQQRQGPVDGSPAGGGVRVSDPSDRFEQAATRTADQVLAGQGPAPPVQRAEAGEEEEEQVQGMFVQREAAAEEEEETAEEG